MPSPFPGLDPYLESQGYWPDFHAALILYAAMRSMIFFRNHTRHDSVSSFTWSNWLNRSVKTVVPDVAVLEGGRADQ